MKKILAGCALVTLVGCGIKLPPIIITPPTPAPTASPTTSPSTPPTAPPTPVPTAPPTAPPPSAPPTPPPVVACALPQGTGTDADCRQEAPAYRGVINEVLDRLLATRPDLVTPDGSHILNSAGYHAEVVHALIARGFCAAFVDGEEIALKASNAFSEQYDIESSGGRSIRLYTATCRPAHGNIPGGGPASPPPPPPPSCTPTPLSVVCDCASWRTRETNRNWYEAPDGSGLLIEHTAPPMRAWTPDWRPLPWEFATVVRAVDRDCHVLKMPERSIMRTASGHETAPWDGGFDPFTGLPTGYLSGMECAVTPAVTCPDPSPAPTDPPPAPPTPGECPNLTCVYLKVANVQGPDHLPRDTPEAGGYVVVDGSPLWEFCSSAGRCDDECNATPHEGCRAVCKGRECRPPAGLRWTYQGPDVPTEARTQRYDLCPDAAPVDGRGYHFRLGPLQPGTYIVTADTAGAKDCTGKTLPGYGVGRVTFTVP